MRVNVITVHGKLFGTYATEFLRQYFRLRLCEEVSRSFRRDKSQIERTNYHVRKVVNSKRIFSELGFLFRRTIEHIFGYLLEIKGLQQWYGKFDQIEFDPSILQCKFLEIGFSCFEDCLNCRLACLSDAGSLLLKINEYTE